jgi:hypothetical protein
MRHQLLIRAAHIIRMLVQIQKRAAGISRSDEGRRHRSRRGCHEFSASHTRLRVPFVFPIHSGPPDAQNGMAATLPIVIA